MSSLSKPMSRVGQKIFRIALIGNPNSGKSSLFNALTGLNQKTSNYPGVTVDKKIGSISLGQGIKIELIDFPGIYSLFPNSSDEKIVVEILTNSNHENYPDAILYIATSLELEKHFLLASQVVELGLPMLFCLSMADIGKQNGLSYKKDLLSDFLECPVMEVSSLTGANIESLKEALSEVSKAGSIVERHRHYPRSPLEKMLIEETQQITGDQNEYRNLLIAHHHQWLSHLTDDQKKRLRTLVVEKDFNSIRAQIDETLGRYRLFTPLINKAEVNTKESRLWTERVDQVITNRYFGPLIFFAILFFIFQAIFAWAEIPMTWIENGFTTLNIWVRDSLPEGWLSSLLTDGVIAGLGGVMIFVPQITILFLLISILEEVGYMSRAVFMFDGFMQKFGLNGRSIVTLISSGACAIPAIMSTRTIANWKERLITIMVSPLISCSARIPVYTVLIGFVVPNKSVAGIFNLQGLAFMGIYVLSIVAALLSAWVFKLIIKSDERSFLMIELPRYKRPIIKNVLLVIREKVMSFVLQAGKVILIISVILWFLASYGPPLKMEAATTEAIEIAANEGLNALEKENLIASKKMEASYAGHLGHLIEPAIRPLGFDWKIGIALITSFAAREIFVGTMATIYNVGDQNKNKVSIREKMMAEINPRTGKPLYTLAVGFSLMIFYAFAMQCMSTVAVVFRETNHWKWPVIQILYMSGLAYLASLVVYQLLK